MLIGTNAILWDAKQSGYAVPAPDFIDSNSVRAFVRTAERLHLPVIISYAEVHKDHLSVEEAADLGLFYARRSSAPVALHLDHGMHFDVIEQAVNLGFSSVMVDASDEPLEENIRRTKEVLKLANASKVAVEAELGHVATEGWGIPELASGTVYTDPEEAKRFVAETGVDSLAVSIGTAHGKYVGTPVISFDRLALLNQGLSVPLVLHGGSGSGDENLSRCAKGGICKVNLFTDFICAALDSVGDRQPDSWLRLLREGDAAMERVLEHYYGVLGCLN